MFRLPAGDRDYVGVPDPDHPQAAFFETGPVVGLLVDDLVEARAELEAAGVELMDTIQWPRAAGWFHFRGPDGNVYAVLQGSRALPG